MTFDWDDAWDDHAALPRLHQLREIRNDFRCTLFTVPGRCTPEWCAAIPDWIELAPHGWLHESNYECAQWTRDDLARVLDEDICRNYFAQGWKAPGWQISDACYEELLARDFWVADQHLEDHRRPPGLRTFFYEDGNWHGHIDDVCNNGIEETWETVVHYVEGAKEFRWASEATRLSAHPNH